MCDLPQKGAVKGMNGKQAFMRKGNAFREEYKLNKKTQEEFLKNTEGYKKFKETVRHAYYAHEDCQNCYGKGGLDIDGKYNCWCVIFYKKELQRQ